MRRLKTFCATPITSLVPFGLLVLVLLNPAQADVEVTGNITPSDPEFWASGGNVSTINADIGSTADGALNITGGSYVGIKQITLGNDEGVTGSVYVDGEDSELDIRQNLYIGYNGIGTLTVQNGGKVSTQANEGLIGFNSTATGTAWVSGEGSHLSLSDDFIIGNYGNGTLLVEDGGYVQSERYSYISYHEGSVGSATVRGVGTEWNTVARMYIGLYSTGTLNVEEGALVSVDYYGYLGYYGSDTDPGRGYGTANITGVGSEWRLSNALFVGYWGTGDLNVNAGGLVSQRADVIIGYAGTGIGTATISGAGSRMNVTGYSDEFGNTVAGAIYLGYYGEGALLIEDGAVVEDRSVYIGVRDREDQRRGDGVGTVTGTGSEWNSAESMIVGRGADGTLNVENGGVVNSAEGYIGTYYYDEGRDAYYYGAGNVTVTGAGSAWNNTGGFDGEGNVLAGHFYVGSDGTGTLNVENGALVTNAGDAYIGYNSGSTGTAVVTGSGSQWNSSGNLTVGSSGTGTLSVADGGQVSADGDISIGVNGRVDIYLDTNGANDMLSAGGTLNSTTGSIYFYASAKLAAGDYTPVSATAYNDAADHYVAIGGSWDYASRTFTVAAVQERFTGVSNEDVSGQRIELADNALIVSFGSTAGSVTLDATKESVTTINNRTVLQAYYFDLSSGDLSGQTMVVSYFADTDQINLLSFWREDAQGGTWSAYDPESYSYADGWVNFTVEGFSGYAVAVPEPSTVALVLGLASLLTMSMRCKKTL